MYGKFFAMLFYVLAGNPAQGFAFNRNIFALGVGVIENMTGGIFFEMSVTFVVSFNNIDNVLLSIIESVYVTHLFSLCNFRLANTKMIIYG
jgi:hypothetical protein